MTVLLSSSDPRSTDSSFLNASERAAQSSTEQTAIAVEATVETGWKVQPGANTACCVFTMMVSFQSRHLSTAQTSLSSFKKPGVGDPEL